MGRAADATVGEDLCWAGLRRPPATLSPVITTNQFKNGNHIDVEGTVFKILEFQHVKPGKGGAFVRTKLRRASDGNVIDRTFRAGEKFRSVRTESRKMQFLYADGTDAHFMDSESYEQIAVPEASVADALRWTKPNDPVDVLFIDDVASDLQLPSAVDLEVTETDPGSAATPSPAAATSPPRSRPEPRSRCRCSSTWATACAWTPARASTSRAPSALLA